MILKFLILLSLNYMPHNSDTPDLLEESNKAVIEILGEEIFTNHVKIDSSLTKFYMEDGLYDNLERYNKSTNYKYASVEYMLYEGDNHVLAQVTIDSNKDTVHIMGRGSLKAFKVYFENPTLTRYSELKKVFKKLFPKEELYFSPYICQQLINKCDECNLLGVSDGLIWETRFSSAPLSYNEYGEWDYINYTIFIDAKNPYNHLITSHHDRIIVD